MFRLKIRELALQKALLSFQPVVFGPQALDRALAALEFRGKFPDFAVITCHNQKKEYRE